MKPLGSALRGFVVALVLALAGNVSLGATRSVTLAWDRNSEPDVSGYIIYYGPGSGHYTASTNVGNVTTNVVSGLGAGSNYFFAVTAYNTSGLESEPSNEISYTTPTNAPAGFAGLPTQLKINKNNSALIPFTLVGVNSNLAIKAASSKGALLPIRTNTVQGSGTNRSLLLAPVRNKFGNATITLSFTQGLEIVRHVIAVGITASNNAPTMTAPPSLAGWKQALLPFAGVLARDLDAPSAKTADFRLILTAAHGIIKIRTTIARGVGEAQVKGNGTRRVVITAPLAAINRTLAGPGGVAYRGNLNFVGADSITAVLSDRGNTGVGGAKSCSATTAVTVEGDGYDVWRNATFSEADLRLATKEGSVWGDNADPDADGRDNLMEFALGSDAYVKDASTNGVVSSLFETNAAAHLSLRFMRRLNQDIVAYLPEISADGHSWSSVGLEFLPVQPLNASFETQACRDTTAVTPGQVRMGRLRLARGSRGSTSDVFVATASLVRGATNSEPSITPVPVPFVLPSVYEGRLTAANSNHLVDFSASWAPNAFGGRPFGVELESGETLRIVTNDLNTLMLERTPAPMPLVGNRFRIRPLLTLDEMFATVVSPGADMDSADNVLLFDAPAQQTQTAFVWTNAMAAGWRDQNDSECSDAVVPAQCATLVRRRTAGNRLLVAHGVIGRTPGRLTIFPGLNWVAAPITGDPLTLDDLRLHTGQAATGLAAGIDAAAADTLMVFPVDQEPASYFYSTATGAAGWRDLSMTQPTNAIGAGSAILVDRKAPRASFVWRVPRP